jgi:hypothetical protein
MVGQPPKTAWVINYSLLERIHYLLVAGFDVYGNAGHQLHTRLYMDFLRMEGEHNFLSLLPPESRNQLRDHWYRGAGDHVKRYIHWDSATRNAYSLVPAADDPKLALFDLLKGYLSPVLSTEFDWQGHYPKTLQSAIVKLQNKHGETLQLLPQLSLVQIQMQDGRRRYLTLINNSAHNNISHPFSEEEHRLPAEDTLTVVNGVLGSYPNALYRVHQNQFDGFVDALVAVSSQSDYQELRKQYGVLRTDKQFWQYSDQLQADYRRLQPGYSGLLDYNRLQNR